MESWGGASSESLISHNGLRDHNIETEVPVPSLWQGEERFMFSGTPVERHFEHGYLLFHTEEQLFQKTMLKEVRFKNNKRRRYR